MKARILALVAVALLATTAVALAKSNTLTGKIEDGGKVTIKVKLSKKGTASKITSFTLTNLTSLCEDGQAGKTMPRVQLGSFKVKRVEVGGIVQYRVDTRKNVNGNRWYVDVDFSSRKGRKVSGTASHTYFASAFTDCTFLASFKARVK